MIKKRLNYNYELIFDNKFGKDYKEIIEKEFLEYIKELVRKGNGFDI